MSYDDDDLYDPWGFKEEEKQKYESPYQTNYRHWKEDNEKSLKIGQGEVEYKPLDDNWDFNDELNHR
jgi:hypothetical protein